MSLEKGLFPRCDICRTKVIIFTNVELCYNTWTSGLSTSVIGIIGKCSIGVIGLIITINIQILYLERKQFLSNILFLFYWAIKIHHLLHYYVFQQKIEDISQIFDSFKMYWFTLMIFETWKHLYLRHYLAICFTFLRCWLFYWNQKTYLITVVKQIIHFKLMKSPNYNAIHLIGTTPVISIKWWKYITIYTLNQVLFQYILFQRLCWSAPFIGFFYSFGLDPEAIRAERWWRKGR